MPSDGHPKFKNITGHKSSRSSGEEHAMAPSSPRSRSRSPIDMSGSQEDAAATGRHFNMNQSIFQLLTAAGSKANFSNRDSSDSDNETAEDSPRMPHNILRSVATLKKPSTRSFRHKRMLQSTPHLKARPHKLQAQPEDQDTEGGASTAGPPSPGKIPVSTEVTTIQPQMLSAALDASLAENEAQNVKYDDEANQTESDLANKLMDVFGLSEPEKVISEYPCWLLKNALLSGFMYITTKHVCFYAYLPKNNNETIKSGPLSKRGHSNPKYKHYDFVLKGHVLSYYSNPRDLYFPSGQIDLKDCEKAEVDVEKGGESSSYFILRSDKRNYRFKADSIPSRKQWISALNKVIFRWKNEGDSVKIALPIKLIEEVEQTTVLEFADTIKLVFLNEQEHTLDDYCFSFFEYGKEALKTLKGLLESAAAMRSAGTPTDSDFFRTTLKPTSRSSSPRPTSSRSVSLELNGRRSPFPRFSGEFKRRSLESNRDSSGISGKTSTLASSKDGKNSPRSPRPLSGDSFAESLSKESSYLDSDGYQVSSDDETASQILSRSRIFQRFSLKQDSERNPERHDIEAHVANVVVHSPTRSNTQDSLKIAQSTPDSHRRNPIDLVETDHNGHQPSGSNKASRAAEWAEWMKKASKDMANKPMGYLEKMSDMWSGGRRHYFQPMGAMPDEVVEDDEDVADPEAEVRFREKFALHPSERLHAVYFGYLYQVIPLYGKIYLGNRHLCFRSVVPGTRTKMVLPLKDIENVEGEGGFSFGWSGLVITVRAHEELFFEFGYQHVRNDCLNQIRRAMDQSKMQESIALLDKERAEAEAAKREYLVLQKARQAGHPEHELQLPTSTDIGLSSDIPPIVFDDPQTSIISFKPTQSLKITCLTIGSRGDVQPYIALCQGLLKEGHKPRIATHAEFKAWIEGYGIEFALVEGDPAELMRICVENGMFTYSFLKEANSKFRGWIDELLASSWVACQGSDVLIESPSAMAGIHIAEALRVPYFRAFSMPWTRTRAYPHAFAVPDRKMGGHYNYFTYVMFDNLFWKAISGQVNRWRKKTLKLPSTNLDKLQPNKTPFLYNFSPSVVNRPLDYSEWIKVTGYWFVEEDSIYEPPKDLMEFIIKARADQKKIVYVGFGSIVVSDPKALTRTVVESIVNADVRCILSKGWSDRLGSKNQHEVEIPLPPEIYLVKSVPHDWLFQRIDAAAHHGGAGTTGASLRAGIPTIIKPFFGDQFFFGSRVEDLGVGICIKKLNVTAFTEALRNATNDSRMIMKARILGEQIRTEDGVGTAIQTIYREMEYAKSLIKNAHVTDDHKEDDSESSFVMVDQEESDSELYA